VFVGVYLWRSNRGCQTDAAPQTGALPLVIVAWRGHG